MICLKLNLTPKATLRNLIIPGLTAFSLVGCTQQTPEAKVESSPPVKASKVAAKQNSPTLNNLQTAYNSESNSNVMYLGFALKAHEEGYKNLATLFKALARAEEIHRDNHADVIRAMGATPNNTMVVPQVDSTVAKPGDTDFNNLAKVVGGNLGNSINRESHEREMYPKFIEQAKSENNVAAFQTFEKAMKAENQHTQLLANVDENLNDWDKTPHSFYVCQVSGETFEDQPKPGTCPKNPNGKTIEQITW